MKTIIILASLATALGTGQAAADSWTWTPISNGTTLDAHLARCNFARPNPIKVFSTIAALKENMASQDQAVRKPDS